LNEAFPQVQEGLLFIEYSSDLLLLHLKEKVAAEQNLQLHISQLHKSMFWFQFFLNVLISVLAEAAEAMVMIKPHLLFSISLLQEGRFSFYDCLRRGRRRGWGWWKFFILCM